MPKNRKYHPDYRALYPGLPIPPKVLSELKKSDRKMEYIEYELKHSRVRRNRDGEIVSVAPPREDSLERLEELNRQFAASALSPEENLDADEEIAALRRCLDRLSAEEQELIHALYYDRLTERKYATTIGVCQKTINKRKRKILLKIKKFLEI